MTRDIKMVHTPKPVAKQGHMYECHAECQHQSQWGQSFSAVVSFSLAFAINTDKQNQKMIREITEVQIL